VEVVVSTSAVYEVDASCRWACYTLECSDTFQHRYAEGWQRSFCFIVFESLYLMRVTPAAMLAGNSVRTSSHRILNYPSEISNVRCIINPIVYITWYVSWFHRKILTTLFCPSTEANSILWKTKGEWPIKRYTTYTKEYFSENKLWEDNGYLVSSRVRRKLLNFKGTVLLLPFSFLRKTGLDNR